MTSCFIAGVDSVSLPILVSKQFAPQLRRADEYIKLGVAATEKVFPGLAADQENNRAGLFVGTAFGPMQTNFDVLGLIVDEDQTSPTLFSHSVFNSAAGYIARLFGIAGSCFSFTDFGWPFFQALAEGHRAITSGRLDRCLVLQVETYSDLLIDARQRTETETDPWLPGAVAWHLATGGSGTGWNLKNIEINSVSAPPPTYLHRREELHQDGGTLACSTPLAAAASLTSIIQEPVSEQECTCRVTAPYGSVTLTFQQAST